MLHNAILHDEFAVGDLKLGPCGPLVLQLRRQPDDRVGVDQHLFDGLRGHIGAVSTNGWDDVVRHPALEGPCLWLPAAKYQRV